MIAPGRGTVGDPRSAIRPLLLPGEAITWVGQPDVSAYAMRGAWYLIPFSLLWGGFAIFWEVTAIATAAPPLFAAWGVPFVAIGLYMIFGRLYVARREAQRTVYALTDRRIVIVTGAFRPTITEIDVSFMPITQLVEHGSGLGTITFGSGGGTFRPPPGWPTMGSYTRPAAFESVPNAKDVYRLIQDAKAARSIA